MEKQKRKKKLPLLRRGREAASATKEKGKEAATKGKEEEGHDNKEKEEIKKSV